MIHPRTVVNISATSTLSAAVSTAQVRLAAVRTDMPQREEVSALARFPAGCELRKPGLLGERQVCRMFVSLGITVRGAYTRNRWVLSHQLVPIRAVLHVSENVGFRSSCHEESMRICVTELSPGRVRVMHRSERGYSRSSADRHGHALN